MTIFSSRRGVKTRQVRAGCIAFAAGDALGVPWEGMTPGAIGDAPLTPLRAREDWPVGSTSDDTAQLLLMAQALAAADPARASDVDPPPGASDVDPPPGAAAADPARAGRADPARAFIEALAGAAASIRGMGPSSLAAIERYHRDGSLRAEGGSTNGALMRAPAIGWWARDRDELRELVRTTTATTHGDDRALAAAEAVVLWAFDALDGSLPRASAWDPPAAGVSMDAAESAAAVAWVLARASSVADAAETAVRLGGDTDTIAAIAAGILASHPEHVDDPIPWLDQVLLPAELQEWRSSAM